MKKIIFDTGPIITLALNNLLWLMESLKKQSNARFIITDSVKKELIDKPFQTKKFKFEALQSMQYIKNKTIEVETHEGLDDKTSELMELANHCFKAKGEWIKLVHYAEMQVFAIAKLLDADTCVIDERTARMLIEDTERLRRTLQHKMRTRITVNDEFLQAFKKKTRGIKMIRSIELVVVAYEMGLLDRYLPDMPQSKEHLLDSLLWALKLNGSSISNREIQQIIKIEKANLGLRRE
jgi:predicted nucleic acid-binding protein